MDLGCEEWKRIIHDLSEKDRELLEWQAYAFAELILVPRKPLKDHLLQATEKAKS